MTAAIEPAQGHGRTDRAKTLAVNANRGVTSGNDSVRFRVGSCARVRPARKAAESRLQSRCPDIPSDLTIDLAREGQRRLPPR
jgi:hypothetical protein